MFQFLILVLLSGTSCAHRLRNRNDGEEDDDVSPAETEYVKVVITGINQDVATGLIPSIIGIESQVDSEDVTDLDAARLFSQQPPPKWDNTLKVASESSLEGGLSTTTETCIKMGYCKIEEKVICDEGRVKEICQSTNHLFSGTEQCTCLCDPNLRSSCPDLDDTSKRHTWDPTDCSCQCVEDGDAYCRLIHPAKHMTSAPGCNCVCDSTAEATCSAMPQREGTDLWKWDKNECYCVCQLSESDCSEGQVFYDDRCTCTCVDAERNTCLEDTTGTLEWIEESCSCLCKDKNAKSGCIGKQVKNSQASTVLSAADDLGWIWNDAPTCSCECTADDTSCKEKSGGKDWVSTRSLSTTSTEDACGCSCKEEAAEECLKKRIDSGSTSLWLWSPFPSCECSCPSPGTENSCKESSAKAKKAWTERGHTLPIEEYAGHVLFNAEKCSCECKESEIKKCSQRESDAAKNPHFFRGRFKWSGEGSCSCSCSLDAKPSKDGKGDKCTMRDSRLVFDATHPALCKCICGPKNDKISCEEKKKLQEAAIKTMPHLSNVLGKISFQADTCTCNCPVNQGLCDLHNALFDPESCSCKCDEVAKKECEAGASNKYKWMPQGCYCQCLVSAEECAALPKEKEGGTRKILDTSGGCGCTCPSGLGSEKDFCDMKMSMATTGNNFLWNEELCQCTCAKEKTCGKCSGAPELCEIFDEDECACVPIKDALCPVSFIFFNSLFLFSFPSSFLPRCLLIILSPSSLFSLLHRPTCTEDVGGCSKLWRTVFRSSKRSLLALVLIWPDTPIMLRATSFWTAACPVTACVPRLLIGCKQNLDLERSLVKCWIKLPKMSARTAALLATIASTFSPQLKKPSVPRTAETRKHQ